MWYLHNQFMHGSHTCFWNPLFDDMDGTFANEAVTTLCCFSHQSNCSCKVICRESEQDHLSTHSVVVKSISYAAVMHWDTCTLLSNASRRLDSFPLFSEKTVLVNIDLGQCREIHLTIKYVKFRVVSPCKINCFQTFIFYFNFLLFNYNSWHLFKLYLLMVHRILVIYLFAQWHSLDIPWKVQRGWVLTPLALHNPL